MTIYCVDGDFLVRGGGGWGRFGERKAQGGEHGGNGKARPKETAGYTGKTCKTP